MTRELLGGGLRAMARRLSTTLPWACMLAVIVVASVVPRADAGWTQQFPDPKPSRRDNSAMASVGGDQVLLFGGYGNVSRDDETWVYDLSDDTWAEKLPGTQPSARSMHSMASLGEDQVLLFGGYDGSKDDETWVYDLSDDTWTNKAPASGPSARDNSAMASVGGGKVLLFGGYDVSRDDETWVYDLSENAWTLMSPATKPSARDNSAMASLGGDQVLLFGGLTAGYARNDETWVYDLSEDSWTQMSPATKPSARCFHAMVHLGLDKVLLFGGYDGYYCDETWVYDLSENTWIEMTLATAPSARQNYAMAFSGGGQVLLFGGYGDGVLGDTWVYGPGITVAPTSGLTTTESGGTATFDVTAHTPPEDPVTVPLFSSDTTEGTVPASVVLPAHGTAPVPVTVTGADDAILDGDVGYTIVTGNATSPDEAYEAIGSDDVADVTVTNQDDGEPVHVVSTSPAANACAAACSTNVTATLDEYIAPATVHAATYVVHAGFSGVASGGYWIGSVVFDPAADLHPGELIEATVTDGVCTPSGFPATPYVWRFRTAVDGGYGRFTESVESYGTSFSRRASLGDLDGDGDLDAFVANPGVGGAGEPNRVWLNDGDGTFTESTESHGTFGSCDVSLGDLDGDGNLDAFVANGPSGTGGEPNRVWLNDGDGTFTQSGESYGSSVSQGIALGDLDGDGDLDAFVANRGASNGVWLNDGDGTFTQSAESYGDAYDSMDVVLGDLDGDGDLDAFVANLGANRVWSNDSDGTFTLSAETYGSASSIGVALADFDGDGNLDAFVADYGANSVWLNDGDGTFTQSAESYGSVDSHHDVAIGDLDGDGDLDAFVANYDVNRVWLNDGDGTFTQSVESYGSAVSYGVALGDLDGDGDLDAFVANPGIDDTSAANRVWLNEEPTTDTAATFRVDPTGRIFADGTFTATLFESTEADVAEWVTVSEPVEAGDVLELDPTTPGSYRLSSAANSSLVAGVVSTQPGVLLGAGSATEESALLALTGIVPVKVTDEGGPIEPGDLLVSSSTPGHAMRWDGVGSPALVGKALEPMTDDYGVILVLLVAH